LAQSDPYQGRNTYEVKDPKTFNQNGEKQIVSDDKTVKVWDLSSLDKSR